MSSNQQRERPHIVMMIDMLIPKQVGKSKVLKQQPLNVDADTSLGGFGSNTDETVFFF